MKATRTLQIRFFALLREQAGCSDLSVTTEATTPAGLYRELMASHGLTMPPELLTYAVNETYVPGDTPLRDGDRLTFIPPVAGG
ncbi:MAG: MoaD/ThiS family protein [Puniceicoccaceae bacterium]|nr:MAG: MoaD/ThiS family protein [Puniceicoccaceae bacterium]